jgi:hypothetical protein
MIKLRTMLGCVALSTLLGTAGVAHAIITLDDLGTTAPPAVLGGYTMTPFGADASAPGTLSSSLASPLGGSITFSTPVAHDIVGSGGSGWATWSHGYQGDVYYSTTDINSLTIGLPANTTAFYFYAEPNQWDYFDITVTAEDGTSLTRSVYGNSGANGFGEYASGGYITSIAVSTTDLDFSIGEFGISTGTPSVPDGGSTLMLGMLGLLGLAAFASRNAKEVRA